MEQALINYKTVKQRKSIKVIQRASFHKYRRGHGAVAKNIIGKLVYLSERKEEGSSENITAPNISQEKLIDILNKSQLTGMSGNGFLTAKKIDSFLQNKTDNRVLIVNGVECEPDLLHDEWLLENCSEEIIAGISLLCKTLKINNSVVAVKAGSEIDGIKLCGVPARYPMGEEHILINQIFGINMEKQDHPSQKGFLVLNVQTVYQIYRLCQGIYKKGRYVTLANLDTGEAKVAYVNNGESIRRILEKNFVNQKNKDCFAGNGILSAHKIVEKECFEDNISFAAIGVSAHITNENLCKKCGKCVRKCPMGVNVKEIVKRREQNANADITGLGLEKCIHCNSCTYFCKAGKNITSLLV